MGHEDEDGVPVLNDVIESGNESIIQSSRLGREVLRELQVLQQSSPVKFVLQDHLLEQDEGDEPMSTNESTESQLDLMIDDPDENNDPAPSSDEAIELMIDEVVDRHITELRRDIRQLLARLKQHT